MAEARVDVAVVGAGVVGSCAALSLQRAGQDTLLIDQYSLPHAQGSSGGQARIIRLANSGPPQLTPIMVDGYKQWMAISESVKEELISPAQMLVVSQNKENIGEYASSMERGGRQPLWLTPAQTNAKYSTRFTEDFLMFEDTTAGALRADRCVAAVQKLYREAGGRVLDDWPVAEMEPDRPWHTLRGPHGVVRARAVVLCAGPWAATLLKTLGVELPLSAMRTQALIYRNKSFPHACFVDVTEKNHIYGLPALDAAGSYKLGAHGGKVVSPGDAEPDLSFLTERAVSYCNKFLPFSEDQRGHVEHCWYSYSADKNFVLDRHPHHPNILFATGFSGTGFKYAPTVGNILSGMLLGRDHGFDVSPFGAWRFGNPKGHRSLVSRV